MSNVKPDIIVAIDFGMTGTAVAYARPKKNLGHIDVQTIKHWNGENGPGSQESADKVPTMVSFMNKTIAGWGFETFAFLHVRLERAGAKKKVLDDFEVTKFFKTTYQTEPSGSKDFIRARRCAKEFLAKLKTYIEEYLDIRPATKAQYVFSYPTTWDKSLKADFEKLLEEVGYRPLDPTTQPSLLTLDEASAALIQVFVGAGNIQPEDGEVVLIADVGGGTCDISLCKVLHNKDSQQLKVELMESLPGQNVGSSHIDEACKAIVEPDLRKNLASKIRDLKVRSPDSDVDVSVEVQAFLVLMDRMPEYIKQKHSFGSKPGLRGDFSLSFHNARLFKSGYTFESKTQIVFGDSFDAQCKAILDLFIKQSKQLREISSDPANGNIQHVVMAGGLGSSKYVSRYLEDHVEDFCLGADPTISAIEDPHLAVCRGLVRNELLKLRGEGLLTCKAKSTYGLMVDDDKESAKVFFSRGALFDLPPEKPLTIQLALDFNSAGKLLSDLKLVTHPEQEPGSGMMAVLKGNRERSYWSQGLSVVDDVRFRKLINQVIASSGSDQRKKGPKTKVTLSLEVRHGGMLFKFNGKTLPVQQIVWHNEPIPRAKGKGRGSNFILSSFRVKGEWVGKIKGWFSTSKVQAAAGSRVLDSVSSEVGSGLGSFGDDTEDMGGDESPKLDSDTDVEDPNDDEDDSKSTRSLGDDTNSATEGDSEVKKQAPKPSPHPIAGVRPTIRQGSPQVGRNPPQQLGTDSRQATPVRGSSSSRGRAVTRAMASRPAYQAGASQDTATPSSFENYPLGREVTPSEVGTKPSSTRGGFSSRISAPGGRLPARGLNRGGLPPSRGGMGTQTPIMGGRPPVTQPGSGNAGTRSPIMTRGTINARARGALPQRGSIVSRGRGSTLNRTTPGSNSPSSGLGNIQPLRRPSGGNRQSSAMTENTVRESCVTPKTESELGSNIEYENMSTTMQETRAHPTSSVPARGTSRAGARARPRGGAARSTGLPANRPVQQVDDAFQMAQKMYNVVDGPPGRRGPGGLLEAIVNDVGQEFDDEDNLGGDDEQQPTARGGRTANNMSRRGMNQSRGGVGGRQPPATQEPVEDNDLDDFADGYEDPDYEETRNVNSRRGRQNPDDNHEDMQPGFEEDEEGAFDDPGLHQGDRGLRRDDCEGYEDNGETYEDEGEVYEEDEEVDEDNEDEGFEEDETYASGEQNRRMNRTQPRTRARHGFGTNHSNRRAPGRRMGEDEEDNHDGHAGADEDEEDEDDQLLDDEEA